ncbi:MAG: peptidase C69 [candidate division Zixibacteria bacterium RBG_16_48_11]|nr:MAG: peptidase C69 [candidate division Zixibacteria bacterium RBG_16_48_11]
MKELALSALETAKTKGATYADIRLVNRKYEFLNIKDGAIGALDQGDNLGFGIRVIAGGAWGFASSDDLSKESFDKTAALAVKIAKASARTKIKDVKLAPAKAYTDSWEAPYKIDPFTVLLEKKLELLHKLHDLMVKVKGVSNTSSTMSFVKEEKTFASTEGSYLTQIRIRSGVGMDVTATDENDTQDRSFPAGSGQSILGGYELIEELPLEENAQRIAEEAVALLTAPVAPGGKQDLIIGASHLGLQIHESCGHPIELDRVMGEEAGFMGKSFLTPDKLGTFKYGSDIVTIVANSTEPRGLGTFAYDDEGVSAQRWDIVKNGIFKGYLTSRETCSIAKEKESRGCMRADGWNRIPMIRMVNISLMPGTWKLEDLIEDTQDGLLLETTKSWSIDQLRLNFQFACQVAWEIKNGKKGKMYKNPVYQGITNEFWNSCDAICNQDYWALWGTPNCGKGEPMQSMEMSHGASPARFRQVTCGAGYTKGLKKGVK